MVIEDIRQALAQAVISRVRGDAPPPQRLATDDPGWFGPGSAAWEVHSDIATLVGGIRSLLLQSLHPLPMAAVHEHSQFRDDPWGRVQRTAKFLGVTVFGSSAEAEAACASLRAIHDRVSGVAPDGQAYSANDPHLLEWVHVTEVESFLMVHQRYGARPLSPARQDQYIAEMARVATAIGVLAPPLDRAELKERLQSFRPELRRTDQSAEAARFVLLDPPLPLTTRPAYGVLAAAAYSSMPLWAQAMVGPPLIGPVEPLAVRPAARALLSVLRWSLAAPAA
ncbi:MAG: hypothetical protein JWL70_1778 [Acidimicrobiia bacterium]|nr:hypothetical protein [Acidimicrobiia bacterium]